MIITDIRTRALLVPHKKPYHWAHGIKHGAVVVLIEVDTDAGITGIGECIGTPAPDAIITLYDKIKPLCIGQSPFAISKLTTTVYQANFVAQGPGSARRFAGLLLAGLEMALWDIAGKATGRPVHELLGGAVRDEIRYFGFPQGDSPEEIAAEAKVFAEAGCEVIYVKIGRGEQLDIAIAKAVRSAIGDKRLRLDPNEAWDTLTAQRMIKKLAVFDPECIEQPTSSDSIAALRQVRQSSGINIAADQIAFTPEDVYEICRQRAADLIVLGIHETGGLLNFKKAAAIAEAAGINICLHGMLETGITTCACNQLGATIANLDDGNQYMNHLLSEDIVSAPDLSLNSGKLAVSSLPGLGFEIDYDAVARAAERYQKQ